MSTTTRPPTSSDEQRRLDRLPRSSATPDRGREVRLGVLGVLGVAVLVIGVPVALVLLVGYPLPRSGPSRDWLTVSLSSTLLINILACLIWLVWAHFVVCLISEWRALRRGRLPSSLPLGGGSQLLARRLVAAVLLLAGTAAIVPHGGGASPGGPPAARTAAVSSVQTASTANAEHGATAVSQQTPASAEAPTKFYVVEPPEGRRYDSLWDISQRTLGDPLRYKEIFALNAGRDQADGRALTNASLIRPGWQLILPADAAGPGVQEMAVTPPPVAPPAPGGSGSTSGGGSTATSSVGESTTDAFVAPGGAGGARGGSGTASAAAAAFATASPTAAATDSGGPTSLLVGGGLILAGLALALSSRRGPYGEPVDEDVALTSGSDPELATALDRALRELVVARTAQRKQMPQPVVAYVSADQIVLHLAGGDPSDPPAPWQASDDGRRSWSRPLDPEAPAVAVDGPAPYPGLISVGRSAGFDVFLDLEQAPGVVSFGGDDVRARDLVTAIAVQAATSAWSDGATLTMVGFAGDEQWEQLDSARVRQVRDVSDVLDELEQEQERVVGFARRLGIGNVLTGRQVQPAGPWQPRIVVLSAAPSDDEAARLARLTGDGRTNTIALCVGDLTGGRWRFAVDATGRLDLGVLGLTATAHRLVPADVTRVLTALARAAERGRRDTEAVREAGPRAAVELFGSAAGRGRVIPPAPVVPPAPTSVSLGGFDAASLPDLGRTDEPAPEPAPAFADALAGGPPAAAITLLGPVAVRAPGPVDAGREALATEIAVAVALAADGLHDVVLRASIWPRGVSDDVAAAAIADVQTWLGSTAAGPRLYQDRDGRWQLASDVLCDLDLFTRLADRPDGGSELEALGWAVDLISGEACSATPTGRYGWLTFVRAARDVRALGTVVVRRYAALLVAAGRRLEAIEALRRGLVLVPTSEPVWRDLFVLLHDGEPAQLRAEIDRMYAALRLSRLRPEAETDALVAQLDPRPADPAGVPDQWPA